jgi:hypothetical protein
VIMLSESKKIEQDKKTVEAMIKLYCKEQHGGEQLCPDCKELFQYAMLRLSKCKFGEDKPTCGKCPVHCYKPDMREKILQVMKFSGPRMLRAHPLTAIRHLLQGFKKVK